MTLLQILLFSTGVSGALMFGLTAWYRTDGAKERRIREEPDRKLVGGRFWTRVMLNGAFSGLLSIGLPLYFGSKLFYSTEVPVWKILGQAVLVLAVYDFTYYFLHRFPFHEWEFLKKVHSVHHMARYPQAADSLYLHPLENFLGLALLMVCTWACGPIHLYAWGIVFFLYTQLNVLVHAGLELPGPFKALSYMSRKHDKHHQTMRSGNYASITPIPDLLFGTAE